ncbi:hypothetical protein ACFFK0_04415 [Paenibacillus chartarius]|uniref:Uncharacterized protein n=1 Tax=Paenibacillus chartarius TaxID=747481 RepID=A0ABV6DGF1_9BACL
MSNITAKDTPRYPRLKMSTFNATILRMRNPYVQMWWSAALPGFGHLMLGKYLQGFILVGWEFFANMHASLNQAIYMSMVGDFDGAKATLNLHWALLYISVYVFTIWDVYARTIDLNKVTLAAIRSNAPINPMNIGTLGIHGLRPVKQWLTIFLTLFMPGLGQLYLQSLMTGIFSISLWLAACYYSNFPIAVVLTLTGRVAEVSRIVDMQWILFLPSLYCFALYDALASSITVNRIYETELGEHLKRKHQQTDQFNMPI